MYFLSLTSHSPSVEQDIHPSAHPAYYSRPIRGKGIKKIVKYVRNEEKNTNVCLLKKKFPESYPEVEGHLHFCI